MQHKKSPPPPQKKKFRKSYDHFLFIWLNSMCAKNEVHTSNGCTLIEVYFN